MIFAPQGQKTHFFSIFKGCEDSRAFLQGKMNDFRATGAKNVFFFDFCGEESPFRPILQGKMSDFRAAGPKKRDFS